jgi:hypothetical protein
MFGQSISEDEGNSLKERFQKNNPGKTRGVIFDRASFEKILAHRETHYVTVFFGETEEGVNTVVLCGYDKNHKAIAATTANRGGPCPPYC